MPSLYKRPGSKVFQCAFYVPDPVTGLPRQVRKSTGSPNRQKAQAAAAKLEHEAKVQVGAGEERSRKIQAVLVKVGEEAVRETLNAARARTYLAEIVRISTGEELPAFTVRTWLEEWQGRKQKTSSTATNMRYRTSVKAFTKWMGTKADKPLESVTMADVRGFRDRLQEEGRTASTCNHYVKDIGSGFRAAVREGLILHNPISAIDALAHDDSIDRKPFTRAEIQKLLAAAPSEDWRGAILTGVFTGLRLGDVATLKWSAVDLLVGNIRLMPTKTKRKKREVTIPLHDDLRAFLEALPSVDDPSLPVFPSLAKVKVSGNTGLSLTFGAIMEAAGVSRGERRDSKVIDADGKEKTGAGRTVHARGYHSLRHTFTSWLANQDVPEEVRMKMTGHTNSAVHQIYSHHEMETLSRAISKVPGLSYRD